MTMAEREQKRRTTAPREDEVVEEVAPPDTERADKIKAELDDLLDEIDEVLDENAEEFVRSYVQKGGQ
jgi:ubiquitin-like protein Pup